MEDEDDDGVIFENSALHHHLEDIGWVDVETSVAASSKKSSPYLERVKDEGTQSQELEDQVCGIKNQIMMKCTMFLKTFICKPCHVSKYHSLNLLTRILESQALEEEDAVFLENLVKELRSPPLVPQPSFTVNKLRLSSILATGAACVYSYLIPGATSHIQHISLALLGAVGCAALVVEITNLVQYYKWNREWVQLVDVVINMVTGAEVFGTLSRKCLRLIQEMELISRGFTMATVLTPAGRLEMTSGDQSIRQSPKLRKSLFHEVRKCIMDLRKATSNLIEKCPVDEDMDSMSNYVAFIPLEQYGPCLSIPSTDHNFDQLMQQVTDGYSITALKALCHVCNIHTSEYLRRFALTFLSVLEGREIFSHEKILKCAKSATAVFEDHTCLLKRSYDIHKCSWKSKFEERKLRHSAEDRGPGKDIYTAVHSLQLHLQAAMKKLETIENVLEDNDHQVSAQTTSYHQNLVNEMQGIQRELVACTGCWEESMDRIDKLLAPQREEKVPFMKEVSSQPADPDIPAVPLLNMDNIIIEDQVFEAYTDPDEVEESDLSYDPLLSTEEKEKKKRERQEAVRLLNELKSVIGIRAKDWEERERKLVKTNPPEGEEVNADQFKHGGERATPANCDDELSLSKKDIEEEDIVKSQETKQNRFLQKPGSASTNDIFRKTTSISESELSSDQKEEMKSTCQKIYSPNHDSNISTGDTARDSLQDGLHVDGSARGSLQDRLETGTNSSVSFAASIAAMAAAKSRREIQLSMHTYQDSEESDEGDCIMEN